MFSSGGRQTIFILKYNVSFCVLSSWEEDSSNSIPV